VRKGGGWIHLALFLATALTTTVVGAVFNNADPLSDPAALLAGVPFAVTLLAILLVHEMGHYLVARRHGVEVTLPYFIPAPTIFGTLGAFIRMRSPPPDRRALFDVAVAGPLAGLALAIPAVLLGLSLSTVRSGPAAESGGVALGSSLLLELLTRLALGTSSAEAEIIIHSIGYAGWIGLFVTALNLLPVGQLDGGHIAYALLGARHIWVSRLAFLIILSLGIGWWRGWLLWNLLLVILGVRHPPAADPYTPLDGKRKLLGAFTLLVLIVTFIPAPISITEPQTLFERSRAAAASP
jgi:membrane-associated protease RseP (regulator of RpoE activity)